MNNFFKVSIDGSYIYDKLSPDDKLKFKNIQIVKAEVDLESNSVTLIGIAAENENYNKDYFMKKDKDLYTIQCPRTKLEPRNINSSTRSIQEKK